MTSRNRRLWLSFLALCSFHQIPVFAAESPAKPAGATPNLPAVMVAPAKKRPLARQTEFIGRVEAVEKVDLRARVTGFLRERNFQAGSMVKKGDQLFLIEPEPFEATVAQRKAQVFAAQATLDNANLALDRYETLEARQAVSAAQRDQKVADQKNAAANVEQAKAALKEAEIQLSYTKIIAPFSGRIGRSSIDPGNLVSPSSGVLTTLVRADKMYVLFPVTQAQLLAANKNGSKPENLKVRAVLADGSLFKEPGSIDFLDVKVDPRTDSQLARAIFDNPDGVLTDGQTMRLVLERKDPDEFVTVPEQAVVTDQSGAYVFVIGKENTVEQRRIKTAQSRDGVIVVTDGIKEGESVIVEGLQKVRAGQKVTTKESAEASTLTGGTKQ